MLVSHNPDEKEEFAVLSERTIEFISLCVIEYQPSMHTLYCFT